MKNKKDKQITIKVNFNYKETNIKAFNEWLGVVIWMLWKNNHITNQCFNSEIENIVKDLSKFNINTKEDFIDAFNSLQTSHGVEHANIKVLSYGSEEEEFEQYLKDVYKCWKSPHLLNIKEIKDAK